MKELLVTIASALVEDKSAVQVTVDEPDAAGAVRADEKISVEID